MPPTLQQSPHSSIEAMQWQTEMEDKESGSYEKEFEGQHRWTARDGAVIARIEQHLNKSDSMRVEIDELESLLGQQTRSKRDPSCQCGEMGEAFEDVGCAGEGMPCTQGRS